MGYYKGSIRVRYQDLQGGRVGSIPRGLVIINRVIMEGRHNMPRSICVKRFDLVRSIRVWGLQFRA